MRKILICIIITLLFLACLASPVSSNDDTINTCDDYWNIYIKRRGNRIEKVSVIVFDNEREEIAVNYPKRQDIICWPYSQLEFILFETNYACSFSKNKVEYPLTTSLDTTGEYWKIRCKLKDGDSDSKQIDAVVMDNENKQIMVHFINDEENTTIPFASIKRILLGCK